ncbi:ATP-binding cassette domain-containing protein [Synechococcus sp. HB1133]|uniref:peptidase domain-containing ABC transporter n=1 Tax=unclassified Synechococcus TaxID=2626047 RepID=UPI00140722BB|nr:MULTISPECIES: peptidase domain-containing ABC transporter [unclassified Synechococcus]MCB4421446.1 ATP-binding cassette domain-containing protein [Synechococcus sp. HB1133]MCB4431203.1 ATP-binding cassette domain-containing protein [Synechococcus sp. HBA1120]NHI80388.1 ATP-binding cassette domain-containing protein [Synechococcus sp. HB1133]
MTFSTDTFSELLKRFSPFSELSSDQIDWLSHQARPFHCSVGQQLLVSDRIPEFFYCIVEGRGRLLHHDPALRRPVTLAYAQPGDLIGWAGLARRSPCEWITAATPLKLIGFDASVFYQLEAESPSFVRWLDTNNSPSELMSVLKSSFTNRPSAFPEEREVLRRIAANMTLLPARDLRSLPRTDDILYLWNAQTEDFSLPIGTEVTASLLSQIPAGIPLRIFSVPRIAWTEAFRPPLEFAADKPALPANDPWSNDRYSDLLLLNPDGDRTISTDTPNDTPFYHNGKNIPCVTGSTDVEIVMACLEMYAIYYNVPFRKDVIHRAVSEYLKASTPSLELLGNISGYMGFIGSICDLPAGQLYRVPLPCVAETTDGLAVIFDISKSNVRAVIPKFGRVSFPLSDLTCDKPSIRILTLSPGRDSQQKKLGLSWFFPQIKKYRKSLIEVLIASLVLQLLNLAQPLVMQQIFDKVIVQQNLDTLYTLGIVLLGVSLFQGLISAVRTYLFADTTNRIDIALGAQVIHHLLKLPLRYFDRRPVGELQTRLAELGNIRSFLTGSLLTLVIDSLFSFIYIGVMLVYSSVLTAVTLGVIPLFLGLTVVSSPLIRGQLRKAAIKNASTQSFLVESLSGVQTIKAQNAENNVRWQWQRRYSSYMSETFKTLMIGVSSGTVGSFLSQLTGLLTLWVGAFLVISGDLTVGQLIAFRIISGYVVGPLLNLATSWQTFQGVALSLERLSDVIDAKTEAGPNDSDLLPLPPIAGEVIFQEVDFRFSDHSQLVVNRVSFDVQAGSFVGIVGRSGSGKSTVMKLLPRLYTPSAGRILIDGYDIAKLQLSSVRRQIGIVPQDSLLFEGTIKDNISLTSPDATFDDIVSAAKVACAHDFIMEQQNGYASRIGERGSGLSGGQRQRIAIARAVLQRPSLLILDEATSALDYLTERQVCLNLKREFLGSTVFFITHRLSTIRTADIILMMEQGYLVEKGSHDELIKDEGRYYALYTQQESDID